MGDVLVLAWTEEGSDGRVVVPAWAVRAAGLGEGVWEVVGEPESGRVVLRRVEGAREPGPRPSESGPAAGR